MTKFLSLLAIFATSMSFSAPVFADTTEATSADTSINETYDRDWNDRTPPRWETRGGIQCRARNVLGRSFTARGNWQTSQQWVANRALTECRQRSFPLIARTCQLQGCSRVGGRDDNGPGRAAINIRSAVYGANCAGRGINSTGDVSRSCEGRSSCAYTVDVQRLGDPAYGCRKDFRVQYECRGRLLQAYLSPEANGQTLQIRCN